MRTALPLLAAALALALTAPASAAETHGVAAAFGNTVKSLYPDGRYQRLWLRADGSWDAIGRRGTSSSGKWMLKDAKVCLRQSKPFPAPFTFCTEFPVDGGVGVQWSSKDMKGVPIKVTLVPGIDRP